tara:strand:+ start:190 stop:330 length:141 start_codon:yes stop_codon:yes gene_type:complete
MRLAYNSKAYDHIPTLYTKVIMQWFLPRAKVLLLDADKTLWRGVIG